MEINTLVWIFFLHKVTIANFFNKKKKVISLQLFNQLKHNMYTSVSCENEATTDSFGVGTFKLLLSKSCFLNKEDIQVRQCLGK